MAMRLATINQLRNGYVHPFFGNMFAFPTFAETRGSGNNAPSFDIFESTGEYILKSDLPGFDKESINLTYENKTLTLSGERKRAEVEGMRYHRLESFSGKFSRSIKLPVDVDPAKISAELANGVLTVSLPKAEAALPKQINISIG